MKETFFKRIGPVCCVLLLLATIAIQLISPHKASAIPVGQQLTVSGITLEYTDRAHIKITDINTNQLFVLVESYWGKGKFPIDKDQAEEAMKTQLVGQTFTDSNFDDDVNYKNSSSDCSNEIDSSPNKNPSLSGPSMGFTKLRIHPYGTDCTDLFKDKTLAFYRAPYWNVTLIETHKNVVFNWVDAGTLERVDGNAGHGNFVIVPAANDPSKFWEVNSSKPDATSSDQDYIHVTSDTAGAYHMKNDCQSLNDWFNPTYDGCPDRFATVDIGNVPARIKPAGSGTSSTSSSGNTPTCQSQNPGALSVFLCPAISVIDGTLNSITSTVEQLLAVNFQATQENVQLHSVWATIKNISSILLLVVGLIIIIAQALDVGPLDAYTIRKVMPRLVIAVILMQLSWFVFTMLGTVVNQISYGIQALMYAPFGGAQQFSLQNLLSIPSHAGDGGFFVLAAVGVGVGGALLGLAGLLVLALSALLALATGFFVLVLRQMVLIMLLVLSPLALVCWILPGTQKVWHLWWETYSKLLLMFPMIIGLLSAGKLFAYITLQASGHSSLDQNYITSLGSGGVVYFVVAVVAIFAPFFLFPKTFALAGSVFGNLAGSITNRAKGLNEGLAGYRANKRAENLHKLRAGERFSDRNPFTRRINSVSQGIATGGLSGLGGLNQRGKANIERARNAAQAERMKVPGVQDGLFDDDVRLAVMMGSGRKAEAALRARGMTDPEEIRKTMGMARSIGFDRTSQLAALNFEAANKSRNFVDGRMVNPETGVAMNSTDAMNETINEVAASTGVDAERLRQNFMYAAGTQGGRLDLRAESVDKVIEGKFDTRLLQASTPDGVAPIVRRNLELLQTGSDDQKRRAGAQLLATQESLSGMGEASRDAVVGLMQGAGIDYTSGAPIEAQLAGISGGIGGESVAQVAQRFRTTSSTYSQGTPGAVIGGAAAPPPPPPPPPSDMRLKRDIQLVGQTDGGINLYSFRYIWGEQFYVGVMAQEIMLSHADAVGVDPTGYYNVDYYKLGLRMVRLEEWERAQAERFQQSNSVELE